MHGLHRDHSGSLHREVLLSLRFIFGKTRKSRRRADSIALLGLPNEERDMIMDELLQGTLDQILVESSNTTIAGKLPREDVLTPWENFPLLGERLLQIQRYSREQRATSTGTMIREKRNTGQWHILWVVVLIGGLNIILSALQVAMSVARLARSN